MEGMLTMYGQQPFHMIDQRTSGFGPLTAGLIGAGLGYLGGEILDGPDRPGFGGGYGPGFGGGYGVPGYGPGFGGGFGTPGYGLGYGSGGFGFGR